MMITDNEEDVQDSIKTTYGDNKNKKHGESRKIIPNKI